jgi:hypothetical protein
VTGQTTSERSNANVDKNELEFFVFTEVRPTCKKAGLLTFKCELTRLSMTVSEERRSARSAMHLRVDRNEWMEVDGLEFEWFAVVHSPGESSGLSVRPRSSGATM